MIKLSAPIHELKRQAKSLSRQEKIPLHQALDRIAAGEGFAAWSLLTAKLAVRALPETILSSLTEGELFLIVARPGHGKTTLGLKILHAAARKRRRAVFFTLEYTEREARKRLADLWGKTGANVDELEIVTSDDISADFIVRHLQDAEPGTVVVVDYLQILDQQRRKPALHDQILALSVFAGRAGIMIGFISQVDRRFDPGTKRLPDISDIRMPNAIDVKLFSKACFLHEEEISLTTLN